MKYSLTPELTLVQKNELKWFLEDIFNSSELQSTRSLRSLSGRICLYTGDNAKRVFLGSSYDWSTDQTNIYIGTGQGVPFAERLGILITLSHLVEPSDKLKELIAKRISEYLVSEYNGFNNSLVQSSVRAEGLAFNGEIVAALVDGVWSLPSGEDVDVSGEGWTVCSSEVPVTGASTVTVGGVFRVGVRVRVREPLSRDGYPNGVIAEVTEDGQFVVRHDTENAYRRNTTVFAGYQLEVDGSSAAAEVPYAGQFPIGSQVRPRPFGPLRGGGYLGGEVISFNGIYYTVRTAVGTVRYAVSEIEAVGFQVGDHVRVLLETGRPIRRGVVIHVDEGSYQVETDMGPLWYRVNEIELVPALDGEINAMPEVETVLGFPIGARVQPIEGLATSHYPHGVVTRLEDERYVEVRYDRPNHYGANHGLWAPNELRLETSVEVAPTHAHGFSIGSHVRVVNTQFRRPNGVVERESGQLILIRYDYPSDNNDEVGSFFPNQLEVIDPLESPEETAPNDERVGVVSEVTSMATMESRAIPEEETSF